jgi:hypothetical protein
MLAVPAPSPRNVAEVAVVVAAFLLLAVGNGLCPLVEVLEDQEGIERETSFIANMALLR